ncbi:hypothetical protein AB1484_36885 [Parafrankia sp. FMc6]|uniref:hypothetical protein n=1 Tax=Parafrankia soli TaxID=2599596 RepID=UPI0034D4B6C3
MSIPLWRTGVAGRVVAGEYGGRYIYIEKDRTGAGWHIYVSENPPGDPGEGWDIWAENERQIEEWFQDLEIAVEWESG